jgi:hypothetical protein
VEKAEIALRSNGMWKRGPMPPDTWWWGAVVIKDETTFHFADFHGDHVILQPSNRRIEAKDILLYNNSIHLPPKSYKVDQRAND